MLICRDYNKETGLDRAWYDSSNIKYTECDDNPDDFKTLRVVFKKGTCYEYRDVNVYDYLMFMHGELTGSNGKAFHKCIRQKYEGKRLEDRDLEQIEKDRIAVQKKKNGE